MNAAAVEATFQDMQPELAKLANWAAQRYRGNFDELYGESVYLFWKSYNSFDATKGDDFEAYCKFRVSRGLIGYMRSVAIHSQRRDTDCLLESLPDREDDSPDADFDFRRYTLGMSQPAKMVISYIIDPPAELLEAIEARGGSVHNWRAALRYYLRKQLGWTGQRVREAMDEVKEALHA